MAADYLIQTSIEKQVQDITGIARLDDENNGEEADKNLIPYTMLRGTIN